MKNKILGVIGLVAFVAMINSGIFEVIVKFFTWLLMLNFTQSDVSIAGEIFVRIATFGISFASVGVIFNLLGWHNKDVMSLTYFVISTIVSFGLCYVVMLIETHSKYILIGLSILLILTVTISIVIYFRNKLKQVQ